MTIFPAIETYRPAHANDWPSWTMGDLTIMHDGSGWNGTFGLVVKTALADVLTDGPLADVTVVEEGMAKGNRNVWTGTVIGVGSDEITFEGGATVEIERVLAVSF